MLKTLGLFFIILLLSPVLSAQEIQVIVKDKGTSQPVSLVYVNLYYGDILKATAQTNDDGVAVVTPAEYPCSLEIIGAGYDRRVRLLTAYPENGLMDVIVEKKYATLDEVVFTGVSEPVKLKDALSVYQVIPRSVIQAQGAVTLDEAIRNQLNIRIGNDNILGQNVGMQGMTGDKVKILIDGLPVNGREGGNVNIGQLNMNNVERIEMIQGPMSVVYGTDALGGVINIITRKHNKDLGLNINTYYESVGKYNADATATLRLNDRQSVTFSGGRNFFQGWQTRDQVMDYQGDTLHSSRVFTFKPKEQFLGNFAYNYTAPSGFNFNLASDYLHEKVTNRGEIMVWDPFNSYAIDEYYTTKRSMNRLTMNGKLGKAGKWQSQVGYAIYNRERLRVSKDMVTMEETPTSGKGDQDTSSFKDITLRGSYTNSINKITYTAGYDVNLQSARSSKINNGTRDIQDYAAFTNISVPFFKNKLVTQLGARAAYNTSYMPPVIPSVNLLYKPVDKVQLRASYTQGFRAPSLKEMYLSFIDQNHFIVGSTGLEAEKSNHTQLSASYQVYKKGTDYLQFIATGFYNDVYNGIVLALSNPDSPNSLEYTYSNIAHQENAIASLQADGQWRNFHFQLGYSYRYMFADPGNYKAFDASEATAALQYAIKKTGTNLNLFYKYTGKQPLMQTAIDNVVTYNGSQADYHVMDASVEQKFWDRRLQLILGVKNIFNNTQLLATGVSTSSGGVHSGSVTAGGFLPRSLFASLRLTVGK